MRRRVFQMVAPVREIQREDTLHRFDSGLLTSCRTDMSGMYSKNSGNTHVWVYDLGWAIACVMAFMDRRDSIYLDVISNNFALPRSVLRDVRPGAQLYYALEDAARAEGIRKITLDSVPERVAYWRNLGFIESGPTTSGKFCTLYPMEKAL